MAVIDKTIPTDTRRFFHDAGITDPGALTALAEVLGNTRDIGTLEDIRNLALYGCFRDADSLWRALNGYYLLAGASYEAVGHCALDSLAAARTFNEVPTAETLRRYVPERWELELSWLERDLGPNIPEWFGPALIRLARKYYGQHSWNGRAAETQFVIELARYLQYWGYGDGDDVLNHKNYSTARTLSRAIYELAKREPEGKWWPYMPPEEDETY